MGVTKIFYYWHFRSLIISQGFWKCSKRRHDANTRIFADIRNGFNRQCIYVLFVIISWYAHRRDQLLNDRSFFSFQATKCCDTKLRSVFLEWRQWAIMTWDLFCMVVYFRRTFTVYCSYLSHRGVVSWSWKDRSDKDLFNKQTHLL